MNILFILRREVYRQGIKVSIIEPGYFKTDILNYTGIKNKIQASYESSSEEVKKVYGSEHPQKSKFYEELSLPIGYTFENAKFIMASCLVTNTIPCLNESVLKILCLRINNICTLTVSLDDYTIILN